MAFLKVSSVVEQQSITCIDSGGGREVPVLYNRC